MIIRDQRWNDKYLIMNNSKHKVQCQLPKKQDGYVRDLLYYRQMNCRSKNTQSSTSISKNKCLIDVFDFVFPKDITELCRFFIPNFMKPEPMEARSGWRPPVNFSNKVFEFASKAQNLHLIIQGERKKMTQRLPSNVYQVLNEENYQENRIYQLESYKEKLKQFLKRCKKQVESQLQDQYYKGRKFSRQQYEQRRKGEFKIYDISTIMEVQKKITAQTIDQIMNLPSKAKSDYIPIPFNQSDDQARKYLNKMLNELFWCQFVKLPLKEAKFKQFLQVHYKNYLSIQYPIILNGKQIPYYSPTSQCKLMIGRYTPNVQKQVLITLHDLVKIRSQGKNYDKEYFEIVKKLINELRYHHIQTKTYYPLLNPQSILLNQLSLKVHLSYENILLQALGLLAKPKSIEQTICFQPTPQPFDSFASPFQYNTENRIKMFHFLYGSDKYIKTDSQSHGQSSREKLQSSREKLLLMKQSELWRCLMSISFIMNKKKFYDNKFGDPHVRQNYEQFVRYVSKKLDDQPYFYQEVLGERFIKLVEEQRMPQFQPFNRELGIQFLQSLLNPDDNDFSIVKGYQFTNIHKRLNIYYNLSKDLMHILEQEKIFERVSNNIKYLYRFYIHLYMNFSNMLEICKLYKQQQFAKGIILQRKLRSMLNLVQPKARKGCYIAQAKHKLNQYQQHHRINPTFRMEALKSLFKEEYKALQDMYQLYEKAVKNLIEFDFQQFQKDKRQILKFYQQNIDNLCEDIENKLPKIKQYCKNIINKRFIRLIQSRETQLWRESNNNPLQQLKFIKLKLLIISEVLLLDRQAFQTRFLSIEMMISSQLVAKGDLRQKIQNLEYFLEMLRQNAQKNL